MPKQSSIGRFMINTVTVCTVLGIFLAAVGIPIATVVVLAHFIAKFW